MNFDAKTSPWRSWRLGGSMNRNQPLHQSKQHPTQNFRAFRVEMDRDTMDAMDIMDTNGRILIKSTPNRHLRHQKSA
jgi:hypothetical protein